LLDCAHQPHLFNRDYWFDLLWQHNSLGVQPIVARTWGDRCRAWLFLADTGNKRATGLANYYTLAFRPVFCGNPDERTKLSLVIASARRLRQRPIRLAEIIFEPVPREDGSAELLVNAFRAAGWMVSRHPKTASWTANVEGKTFEQYWAERPGALTNTVARKRKKAIIATEIHTRFDPAIWAEYESIYAESWKPTEGSITFLRALAEREGAEGALRLGIARHDGEAIAAQLWTIEPDRALIHKLAYRPTFAQLSPGTILSVAMFKHVIDVDQVPLIDYGTGDEAYKADWMDRRATLDQIHCRNPAYARSWLAIARNYAAQLARPDQHA